MTAGLWAVVAASMAGAGEPLPQWVHGEHLTGDWNGDRPALSHLGLTLDLLYTVEVFGNLSAAATGNQAGTLLGHLDLALTLDTGQLGLWPGGRLFFLGQNTHGTGVNTVVGSSTAISNLEAAPFTQLTEFFYEQALFGDVLHVRVGKQDANREFGTPRYGGNFINNNFGMYPDSPLPSYPNTGLGAVVTVAPTDWLTARAVLFEGNPLVGSLGVDSALQPNAGLTGAVGASVSHHLGAGARSGGITSGGAWLQSGQFPELAPVGAAPQVFNTDFGFFVQHDERVFTRPSDPQSVGGLDVIVRFAWAQPDRTNLALYTGASIAWHGLGSRDNDTVGVGGGYFTVGQQSGGTPGRGSEVFFEAFYKLRLTHFFSLQPDVEYYLHPGGDGRNALLAGLRLKVKL